MSILSGLSYTTLFALGALLLISPFTNGVEHQQGFNSDCDFSSLHCDRSLGLFCNMTEKKCACIGTTVFDANLNYTMKWSTSKGKCVAVEGSVCVGTSDGTLSYGQDMVECETDLFCVQEEKFTRSVGRCGSDSGIGRLGSGSYLTLSLVLPVAYLFY